jgi:hypothetical protein
MADNKTIQKIFSLSDYRKRQLVGEIPERTRPTFREYGYFNQGNLGTRIERIDYSNDTANAKIRGNVQQSVNFGGGSGNSNFGYFGGGTHTRIQRIDYSNDAADTITRSNLISGNYQLAATGNSNFGYFGGGSPGPTSRIDRLDYSNDLLNATNKSFLSYGRLNLSATGNSNFGYFIGGSSPYFSKADRLDYSNDTGQTLTRGLIVGRISDASTGNNNFGYFGGGYSPGRSSAIWRMNYSNDLANSSVRSSFYAQRWALAASGNSNFAYWVGGNSSLPVPVDSRSIVERLDYSNDTVNTTTRGPLNAILRQNSATSSHSFGGTPNSSFASNFTFPTVPNAGYFGGGTDGTNNLASIDKVDYANDTATASVRSALSVARSTLSAIGNFNFGYFTGNIFNSIVDRLEYSSDTQNVTTRGSLQVTSSSRAAVGNQSYGYVNGGSAINRIDYSNDSSTSNRGNLLNANLIFSWSSISSPYYGYFTGGYSSPTTYSGLDRIDFANDTLTASKRTNVSNISYGMSGFGNQSFGYIGGGVNLSLVRRVDYSNDTANISFRGPLSKASNYLSSATSNSNFGYFGGGIAPSTPRTSQVDRINYSNDTAIAQVRGPLPVAKSALAATSPLAYGGAPIYFTNPLPQVFQDQIDFDDSNTLDLPFKRVLGSYGYWCGGIPVPSDGTTSIVNRVDYSNDTVTGSRRGNLASANKRMYAASSKNYGYVAFHRSSRFSRIDFSNDSTNASQRGVLASSGYASSGLSNGINFAYFGGGQFGGNNVYRLNFSNDSSTGGVRGKISNNFNSNSSSAAANLNYGYFQCNTSISRLDFSNDLAISSRRGNLLVSRSRTNGFVGNDNFGYFGGGLNISNSRIERIDYSNDLINATYRGNMLYPNFYASAATGNSNFGYFGGGLNLPSNQEVQRINYSNDTTNASLRGNLPTKMGYHDAITNTRNS